MGITRETAENIRKVNLRNTLETIKTKLKNGGTLSAQELKILETAESGDNNNPIYASSKVQLAAILGVTRQSIHNWLKLDGAPSSDSAGRYRVQEWIDFQKDGGLKGGEGSDLETEKIRNLTIKNELLDISLLLEKNSVAPVDEMKRVFFRSFFNVKSTLYGGQSALALKIAAITGGDAVSIEQEIKDRDIEALNSIFTKDAKVLSDLTCPHCKCAITKMSF